VLCFIQWISVCFKGCFSVLTLSHAFLYVPPMFISQTDNNGLFHNTADCPSQGIQLCVIKLPECFGAVLYSNEIRLKRVVLCCKWVCSSFILFCRVICFRSNCYGIAFFLKHMCLNITMQCCMMYGIPVFMMYGVFIVLIILFCFVLL
jgi:hypothetical protein